MLKPSSDKGKKSAGLLQKYINTDLDKVILVADNMEYIIEATALVEDNEGFIKFMENLDNILLLIDIQDEMVTVAGIHEQVVFVSNNIDSVVSVSTNMEAVTALYKHISELKDVHSNLIDINTVSSINETISAVASIGDDVTCVANNHSSINTVAGSINEVVTIANNLSNLFKASEEVHDKHLEVLACSEQVAIAQQESSDNASASLDSSNLAAGYKEDAEEAAKRAECAAATLTGALIEVGGCDLSGGVYPTPLTDGNGQYRACFWKVTKRGVVHGETYEVGDTLVYSAELNSYYKIDNTESLSIGQADAKFVNKAGDTMTGNLKILSAVPRLSLQSGAKVWVAEASEDELRLTESGVNYPIRMWKGVNGETELRNPHSSTSDQGTKGNALTRKDYVDDNFVKKSGDTMTGTFNVNAGSQINHRFETSSAGAVYRSDAPMWALWMGKDAIRAHRSSGDVDIPNGGLYEKGERVYSPNNKPAGIYGKMIVVDGDANTCYPVVIRGNNASNYAMIRYHISRGYGERAPDTWNTPTHKGGLTFTWEWTGDGDWGGNDRNHRIIQFHQTYSDMVAGHSTSVGGDIVWLRGGGAVYHIRCEAGIDKINVSVILGDYVAGDDTVYSPRAFDSEEAETGRQNIVECLTVRGRNTLYSKGHEVYSDGNKPTWEDVGGNDYLTHETDYGNVKFNDSYIHIPEDGTGQGALVPDIQKTNNTDGIRLGASNRWFSESWVNSYRGGSINIEQGAVFNKAQNDGRSFSNAAIKIVPSSHIHNTGTTSIAIGASTQDRYGWMLNASRLAADGIQTKFSISHHNNSDSGTEVFSVDNDGQAYVYAAAPTNAGHLTRKDYVDAKFVAKAGDTMTGTLNVDGTVSGSTYSFTRLPSGASNPTGTKTYLRKFRGGSGDLIWHETIQGSDYRLATGDHDTHEALKITSNGAGYLDGHRIYTEGNKPTVAEITGVMDFGTF